MKLAAHTVQLKSFNECHENECHENEYLSRNVVAKLFFISTLIPDIVFALHNLAR